MIKNKYFQISTAIDYPSSRPHAGHMYEKICADVIARWKRLQGFEVHFSTGTDCHGLKLQRAADKVGKKPEQFVKEMSNTFRKLCEVFNISYDDFIMTIEERHKKTVIDIFKDLKKKGDIYKGEYEGLYCVDCETFYTEKDLTDGRCPYHPNKKIEMFREETYFFKLSKYKKELIKNIKNNKFFIWPNKKKKEILNRLKEPLKDLSVSRANVSWGIPLPYDKNKTIAVWNDALINYLTSVDYPTKKFKNYWPALHVIGGDIIWHHTVIWGAMLLALKIKLPKVIVHGFITVDGEKLSKSRGIIIDPLELAKKYPLDTLRYFLMRSIPFGDDGDFSEKALKDRHNNELANKLGNLISRVSALAEKYGIEKCEIDSLPEWVKLAIEKGKAQFKGNIGESKLKKGKLLGGSHIGLWIEKEKGNIREFIFRNPKQLREYLEYEIPKKFDSFEFDKILNNIFLLIDYCNWYVQSKKLWATKDKKVLYELADSIKAIGILLWPFIPETCEKIAKHFGFKIDFKEIKKPLKVKKIKKCEILFRKI